MFCYIVIMEGWQWKTVHVIKCHKLNSASCGIRTPWFLKFISDQIVNCSSKYNI